MNSTTVGVKVAAARTQRTAPQIGVPFAPIPLALLRSRNLSPAARLAFAALANHARMKRGEVSTLTNRRLAEAAGLSIAAARRALDELEAASLIRRLYGASQRVRLGVGITYKPADPRLSENVQTEGCAPAAPPPDRVAHFGQQGCASAGIANPGGLLKGAQPISEEGEKETLKSPSLALQGQEEQKPDPAAAGAYLRACVAAARRGEPLPEPPAGVTATKGVMIHEPLPPAPTPSPDATRRVIEGFAQSLGQPLALKDLRRPSRRR